MSVFDEKDLVVYKNDKKKIMSGGYEVKSLLLNDNMSAVSNENNGKVGGSVSSIFSHLAIPAGLLMVNEAHKTKLIQKTGTVKDQVIEKEDELAKAKQDFAKDVSADPTNKQELAKFMDATIKDKAKRDKLKKKVYDDVVAKGFPKEINDWDKSQVEIYKDEVFTANEDKTPDTTEAEEILGAKVTYSGPPTDENKVCPNCTEAGSVVDNRDKKSDPKFSKIPDYACQKAPYGSGCGWAAWSGNESIPSEWI